MVDSSLAFQAFYLPGPGPAGGQRLCLYHPARGPSTRGLVLYVPPFAEEMNKARRMAAMQARALAQNGYSVLQMDLFGCGDSSGDFTDASWSQWVADVLHAAAWLQTKDDKPLWLWGLRSGCLLAVAAARELKQPLRFIFWQPTLHGKTLLQQFLRLKMVTELKGGQAKAVMEGLRTALANGQAVDVAGYALSAGVARGLEAATLAPPAQAERLIWLELSTRPDAALMPASQTLLSAWADVSCLVQSQVVTGTAFWQTTEIEDAPALIAATLNALDVAAPSEHRA